MWVLSLPSIDPPLGEMSLPTLCPNRWATSNAGHWLLTRQQARVCRNESNFPPQSPPRRAFLSRSAFPGQERRYRLRSSTAARLPEGARRIPPPRPRPGALSILAAGRRATAEGRAGHESERHALSRELVMLGQLVWIVEHRDILGYVDELAVAHDPHCIHCTANQR